MKKIIDNRITKIGDKWIAECINCNKQVAYTTKNKALKMLERKTCRNCKKDYRNTDCDVEIYKDLDNKWCKKCSGCGNEQRYTRKDHARESYLADRQCRTCVAQAKSFSNNKPVGDKLRLYNKFSKMAIARNIEWKITINEMFGIYNGICSLTGWKIDITYKNSTASLDRIDSKKGYTTDNIRWVHTMVNMCKNKYREEDFIKMCIDITNNTK